MARIAIVADLHFGARNDDEIFVRNHIKFLDELLFPKLKELNIKHLINLGDTWDKRKIHNIKTYNTFKEKFFKRLVDENITAYFLIGNHDTYYKNTNAINSISEFHNPPFINVINEFEDITIDNITFGMMSWINNENIGRAKEFALTKSTASIMCGHFETIGFEVLKGIKAEHGIPKEWFERFNRVWSGHFHIPSKQGNFEYLGNCYELTWSDYNTRKGFHIYDTDTDELTFINNPHTMFDTLHYTNDDVDISRYQDKIVRVYVEGFTEQNTSHLNSLISSLQEIAYKVDVIDTTVMSVDENVVIEQGESQDLLTTITSITNNIELTGMDNKVLTQLITDLYSEALETK